MRIAVTGSSGLAGRTLVDAFEADGHEVTRVVRSREAASRPGRAYWNPAAGEVDVAGLEGHDAVVHLAGENLFSLWTPAKRRRLRASRVEGTRLLAQTLARLERPPRVLLMASAVGYYGDRPETEALGEDEPAGRGFLPELVRDWEAAAEPARAAGVRVVAMRFGILLSPRGGALSLMLLPFRLGLGGIVGSGRQAVPWLALSELPHVARHLLAREEIEGPVNVTSPNPVPHAQFARTVARVLGRPILLRVPGFMVSVLPGGMAEETVLLSTPAVPRGLLESGYGFRWPELEGALRHELAEG